ncbi:MAG TPA: hypothetical protein DF296_05280 [Candidatus Margulisbacteria bacterium]|nr:hypothetical protein [Candidatus Margulisiibacteriota bacterium]
MRNFFMKTEREFSTFYYESLNKEILVFERMRSALVRNIVFLLVILMGLLGVSFWLVLNAKLFLVAAFFPFLMSIIAIPFLYSIISSANYASGYKDKMMSRISSFVDENLTYRINRSIDIKTFRQWGLFSKHVACLKGLGLVNGTINDCQLELSEIYTPNKSGPMDGEDRAAVCLSLFKGGFFSIDCARVFESEISMGIRERVSDYAAASKKKINISFSGSKMYIAISYNRELFAARVFHRLSDFDQALEYFNDTSFIVNIIKYVKKVAD